MKVSLIQKKIKPDFHNNLQEIKALVEKSHGDIVVLPELHDHPYFCQDKNTKHFALAKPIQEHLNIYGPIAKKNNQYLLVSVYEKAENLYNTALLINNLGQLVGKYRKTHIPSCSEYNETFYFAKDDKYAVFDTPIGKIGMLICYDQWFPECARKLANLGAQIIFIPTAIGFNHTDDTTTKTKELKAWINIHKSHAIANGIYIAPCNRVGFEPGATGIDFWGHSMIIEPFGTAISSPSSNEEIISADIDFSKIEKTRKTWPFLSEVNDKLKL